MKRDEGGKAYNALLALLDDEPPRKKVRKEPQALEEIAPELQNQESLHELENQIEEPAASDLESETDEIDESSLNDDNEGDLKDPFESHFVSPPEDLPDPVWKNEKCPLKFASRSLMQVSQVFPAQKLAPVNLNQVKLKYRLEAPFQAFNGELTDLQREFMTPLAKYNDIFYPLRTWSTYKEIRNISILHMVNHVFKTRDRIVKNNHKIAQDQDLEVKDQGFTRPKVLVLLPMRNSAVDFVEALISISGLKQVENKKRFNEQFQAKSEGLEHKPKDFQKNFKGNTNDLFCLGLKFTRQAVKLYSSFYNSDIVIASPLGLRLIVAGDKKGDYDFLSSIEVLYLDQVEAMQMQSWENMTIIAKHLNLMPKESHECDFSRIRPWYLDNKSKLLRQTIMMSSYATPEMQSVFTRYCHNLQGKLKFKINHEGIMSQIGARIRQVYTRVDCNVYSKDPDARFAHFTTVVLPSLLRGAQSEGTFIYMPTYVDFVRVRNYMDKKSLSFATLSEYTSTTQLSRGRTYFADRRLKMMLYTQRLHYFRRYSIKGCNNVVFYGLPDDPVFYQEIVRFLARTVLEQQIDPEMLKVQVLFTKWDTLKLERVVGTSRVGKLVQGASDNYEFY